FAGGKTRTIAVRVPEVGTVDWQRGVRDARPPDKLSHGVVGQFNARLRGCNEHYASRQVIQDLAQAVPRGGRDLGLRAHGGLTRHALRVLGFRALAVGDIPVCLENVAPSLAVDLHMTALHDYVAPI